MEDRVLQEASGLFGADAESMTFIRRGANVTYEFTRESRGYVLRLSEGQDQNPNLVLAEMDWVAFLADRGAAVASPLRSVNGQLVEQIDHEGETILTSAFEKVEGVHPEGELLNETTLITWGRTLGRLHRLSTEFQPGPEYRRPHWNELRVFQLDRLIPPEDSVVHAMCQETLMKVSALPRDRDTYGLIHADPEPWNMLLKDGALTLIDFDECCYHWFVFDLAVSLMHATYAAGADDEKAFGEFAWDCLLRGYRNDASLDRFWIEKMPLFLRLRLMEDYAFHITNWGTEAEDWVREVAARQRERIETGKTVPDMKFMGQG
jgi:Ser/Thr protein kinase RdoA (MazF antagonist)